MRFTMISFVFARSFVKQATESIALLDTIFGFADLVTLSPLPFCRPEVTTDGPMTIRGGRHPIVGVVQECKFVPNDTFLRREQDQD